MTSAPPVTPASGSPPPIDLPKTVMSGSTPSYCSIAHIVPVRPTPDCTSSLTHRIPWRRQSSWSFAG